MNMVDTTSWWHVPVVSAMLGVGSYVLSKSTTPEGHRKVLEVMLRINNKTNSFIPLAAFFMVNSIVMYTLYGVDVREGAREGARKAREALGGAREALGGAREALGEVGEKLDNALKFIKERYLRHEPDGNIVQEPAVISDNAGITQDSCVIDLKAWRVTRDGYDPNFIVLSAERPTEDAGYSGVHLLNDVKMPECILATSLAQIRPMTNGVYNFNDVIALV